MRTERVIAYIDGFNLSSGSACLWTGPGYRSIQISGS